MASSDPEDIDGPFKFLARSGDYSRVSLEVHSSLTIRREPQLYFKAAMMQLIESCLEIFQATTSCDFDHWLADPVLFRVFQDVFQQTIECLGQRICMCFRTASCMPLWLSLIGAFTSLAFVRTTWKWTVLYLAPLRRLLGLLLFRSKKKWWEQCCFFAIRCRSFFECLFGWIIFCGISKTSCTTFSSRSCP